MLATFFHRIREIFTGGSGSLPLLSDHEIEDLDLSRRQIKILPDPFGTDLVIQNLKTLDLSFNLLREIRPLRHLKNLRFLNLSFNQLETVPEIFFLTEIRYLNLSCNWLTEGPEIPDHLTVLDLGFNRLTVFPPSSDLPDLQYLAVNANRLTTLPPSVSRLHQLRHLDLSSNRLTDISALCSTLTNLAYLDVSNNRICQLPDQITDLVELKSLLLSNNQLNQVPDLHRLVNLETLLLHDNRIRTLPTTLRYLRNLQVISIYNNPLRLCNLNPILIRWLRSIWHQKQSSRTFFSDPENIHDSLIIRTTRESIDRLLQENVYDPEAVEEILNDPAFPVDVRDLIREDLKDTTVHMALQISLADALCLVYPIILRLPEPENGREILISEIRAAEGKCLTGKIVRIVNSLSGLSPSVVIYPPDPIGDVFLQLKAMHADLPLEDQKEKIRVALLEKNFPEEEVTIWLDALE